MPEGATYVGRGTKWGNPFKIREKISRDSDLWPYIASTVPGGAHGLASLSIFTAEQASALYQDWLIEQPHLMLNLDELAGRDLACWCPLPEPGEPDHCHAAVLLAFNKEMSDVR